MTTNKPNTGFWIIAVLALLWNLMGIYQYLLSTVLADSLTDMISAEELNIINNMPSWYSYVFAIAVFAGVLGCLFLLLRKKLAITLFGISLLALLIQMGYWLFGTEIMDILGPTSAIMPLIVIAVGIFLYFYSKGAAQKGWLR
ncbi:hypothetical protein [Constantimarinum furrinae]|uniref:Sugar transporter n=1 Tax=Constantimarinum furrinae TaxID=2562285 RepID=A0A7G8PWI9_9FLAO|nr:hypothetical protein [Constantimarinum furrinae]QNJ98705.1 hypothetical protein ALE3EI_2160 [Constantimarinum furrinae]